MMRTYLGRTVGFLLILLSISTTVYGQATKRLIIGSGKNVHQVYPSARDVTEDDITVDIRSSEHEKYLKPDYILDVSELHQITPFTDSLSAYFDSIIFEHVGDGIASLFESETSLFKALETYFGLLKPGGNFIYESYRTSSSYTDEQNINLDLGLAKLIDEHVLALPKQSSAVDLTTLPSKRLVKVVDYYEKALKQTGFESIEIKVLVDKYYEQFNPSNTPYYFFSISAKKKN